MNPEKRLHIVTTFAAIFEAATLIRDIATTGSCNADSFTMLVESILALEANSFDAIYDDLSCLKRGFETLVEVFDKEINIPSETRLDYLLGTLSLEDKLSRNRAFMQTIQEKLKQAATQAAYFSPTHPNVLSNLSVTYTEIAQTFQFPINISGQRIYLDHEGNLDKIHALLFASLRAAVLWNHIGGTRWQMIFHRKQLIQSALFCLNVIEQNAGEKYDDE